MVLQKDKIDTKCLVLNNSYMPTSIISSQRAFVIWFKGNAEIVDEHDTHFKTVKPPYYPKPSIILIPRWIHVQYKKVPLTKRNIFKRDNYTCVYCQSKKDLTLDHVFPKSKGGKDTWSNLVTSCLPCNLEKSDLTIEEWGKENPKPFRPHALLMLKKQNFVIPDTWRPYLII